MFLRLAVIGTGRMGGWHARNLFKGKVPNAVLAAVCDVREEKLTEFTEKHGKVPTYTDYKLMLEEQKPDGVIIATQHYFHVEIAEYCMRFGCHVLIEKPVSVTTKEAERLDDLVKEFPDTVCNMMYNQRTNPLYRKAKELVDSGKMGALQRANFIVTGWYRSQAYYNEGEWRATWWGEGGGTLINQCVHQLDILQWIAGMPVKIKAETATVNRNISTENEVTAVFTYENGAKCSFTCSAHELKGKDRLELAFEKGRMEISGLRMRYSLFKDGEKEVNKKTTHGYGKTTAKKYKKCYGLSILGDLYPGQQLRVIKNFANVISGKASPVAYAVEGKNALSLINGIYMSAWTGEEISLPIDGERYSFLLAEKVAAERKAAEKK